MPACELDGLPRVGSTDPRVRQFLRVKANRTPRSDRAVALAGGWAVRAAAARSLAIDALFVCPELLRGPDSGALIGHLCASGAEAVRISERLLCRMVERDGPDGVAALARLPRWRLADLDVAATSRVVIADRIGLAGNLGTLIRCADGVGASALVVTGGRVRLGHPLVVKASVATLFSVPVVDATADDALAWLRAHRFAVVAADPAAAGSYRDAGYGPRTAVVVGSERHGLGSFWRDAADLSVSIPMLGMADSLNVGHAAAIVLYEVLSRHGGRDRW